MRSRCLLWVCLWLTGLTACHRAPANVLLVTFDTTRWDHVGYASDRQDLTPNLDALADRGTWFDSATASVPLTLPSHATILTGMEPYRHGVRNNGTYSLAEEQTTLAEHLAARGYRTHAVVSAFVLDSRFGLDQGFAGYDDDLSGAVKESVFMSREITAERTAEKAIGWLEASDGRTDPFFLWVHFFDPHAGYDPPAEYGARFPDDAYSAEISYADAMLGLVIAELERRGTLQDTLVVFLSDHGESLGQHGEGTHGIFIYDATMRVPLLLAGPGVPSGLRLSAPARSVDVMPTILDLLGAPVPAGLDGRSLRPLLAGETAASPAYMESLMPRLNYGWSELRGLRTATTKTILAPTPEVFDLVRDPGELDNLAGAAEDLPAESLAQLDELRRLERTDPFSLGGHAEDAVDRETLDALEALGYTRSEETAHPPELADPKDRIVEFETLRTARSLIDDHSLEEAKSVLAGLLAASPENMDAMLALAHVHSELGESVDARSIYVRALRVHPNHPYAVGGLVRLLTDEGAYDRAESLLIEALSANPEFVDLQVALGRLYEETGRTEQAEARYRSALDADPSLTAAILGLVRCQNLRHDRGAAIELLTRAAEDSPNDPEIVEQLALENSALGDLERAVDGFRRLVVLEPDNPSAWNNLAALLARLDRTSEAVEAARQAYRLQPQTVEIRANLGTMLVLAGRLEEGLGHLDAALPHLPDDTFGASLRAEALEVLGRTDEALTAWMEIAPRDPRAGVQVARLQLERHDREAARIALDDAIDRGGEPIRTLADGYPELRELASEIP